MSYFFGTSSPKPTATTPEEPLYTQQELARKFGSPNTLVTYDSSRILITDEHGRTSTVAPDKLDKRTVRSIESLYSTALTNPTAKIKPNNSEETGEADTAIKETPALGGRVVLRKIERKAFPNSSHIAETPPANTTSDSQKVVSVLLTLALGYLFKVTFFDKRNATEDPNKATSKVGQPSITGPTTPVTPLTTTSAQDQSAVIPKVDQPSITGSTTPTTTSANVGPATEPSVAQTINLNEANQLLEDALNGTSDLETPVPANVSAATTTVVMPDGNVPLLDADLVVPAGLPTMNEESQHILQAAINMAAAEGEIGNAPPCTLPTVNVATPAAAPLNVTTAPPIINPEPSVNLLQSAVESVVSSDLCTLAEESQKLQAALLEISNAPLSISPPTPLTTELQALQEIFHMPEADWGIGAPLGPGVIAATKLATNNSVARSKFALLTIVAGLIVATLIKKYADHKVSQRAEEIARVEALNATNPAPNPLHVVPPPLGPIHWLPKPLRVLKSMINKFAATVPSQISIPLLLILGFGSYYKRQALENIISPKTRALVSFTMENALLGKALIPALGLIFYNKAPVWLVERIRDDLPTFQFVENRIKPTLKEFVDFITPLPVTIAGAATKLALNWPTVSTIALLVLAIYGDRHKTWVAKHKDLLTTQFLPKIQLLAKQFPVFTKTLLATTAAIMYGKPIVEKLESMRSGVASIPFIQNRVPQLSPRMQALVTRISRPLKAVPWILKHPQINAPALWILTGLGYRYRAWLANNKTSLVNTLAPTVQAAAELITFIPSLANKHRALTGCALVAGLVAWQAKKVAQAFRISGLASHAALPQDPAPEEPAPADEVSPLLSPVSQANPSSSPSHTTGTTTTSLTSITTTSTTTTPSITTTSSSSSILPADIRALSNAELHCLAHILTTPGLLQGSSSSSSSGSATTTTTTSTSTPATPGPDVEDPDQQGPDIEDVD